MKREEDVVGCLYADATKRQEKASMNLSMQTQKMPTQILRDGKRDDAHITAKFTKKFDQVFQELDKDNKGTLDYPAFCTFALRLGLITKIGESNEKLHELWVHLCGDSQQFVAKDILSAALRVILLIPPLEQDPAKLHQRFLELYLTSCSTARGIQQQQALTRNANRELTFRPQLTQKSVEIVSGARQKLTGIKCP